MFFALIFMAFLCFKGGIYMFINVIILIIAGGDKSNQSQVINKANKYFEEFKERHLKND